MSTEPNPVSQLGKPPESGGAAQENGDGAAATTSSPEPNSGLDSRSSGKDAQDAEPVQPEDPMRWLIEHWKGEGWDYDEKSGDVWLEFDEGGIHIAVIKGGSVTFKSDAVNGFYEGDRFPVAQVARRLSGGKVGAVKAIEVKAEPIMAKPLLVASPVIPFPVEVFPPVLGKYIQSCAESLDCDPAMVGAPLLCSLAAAIGNSAVVRVKDGFEQPAVLWCMVVAESGSAKSPAADHGLRPLRQVNARFAKEDQRDQAEYRKEKVQHEARSQEWRQKQEGAPPDEPPRPASKMLIVNDATVEGIVDRLSNTPRGLLMDADELSGFLGSLDRYAKGKGADASSYMTFYEARDLTVTRKGQGTVMIPRAHVNIFGTIQPGVVERYLDAMHDEMGFSARFLVVYPERRPMVFNTRGVPAELLEGVEALVEKLARDPGIGEDHRSVKPRVFTVAVDAVSDYKTLQDRLNREAVEDGGILARHLAKLGPATLRFALIIHCCRRALGEKVGEQIDSDSMRAARRLEEYFECQIRRLCDERGLDPSEQRDNRELGWIGRQPNGVTAAELSRRFRRTYRSSDQAAVRLAELERRGVLVQAASDGQSKLGRPTVRYVMQSTPHAAVMPRLAAG